jgi:hypothetical protein
MRRLIFIDDDKTERDAFLRIAGGKYDCALQSVWTHDELLSGAAGLDSHHHLPVGRAILKLDDRRMLFIYQEMNPLRKLPESLAYSKFSSPQIIWFCPLHAVRDQRAKAA